MIESTLWKHLSPELNRRGKFQKVSDRFTPGIPDVLGVARQRGGYAIELKEFKGVRVLRTKFRPGQLDWLEDWSDNGGTSMIIVTLNQTVYVFSWQRGILLETGASPETMEKASSLTWTKNRYNSWSDFVTLLLAL